MKEFDLEAALNGEPVKLRNGDKAYVKYNLLEENETFEPRDTAYPLIGYRLEGVNCYTTSWSLTGKSVHLATMKYDIVGMWEEPKISIEDLPKPFKPEENEVYYVISPNHEEPQRYKARCLDHCSIQNGNSFRTKEDAQKWLDFMKSMME